MGFQRVNNETYQRVIEGFSDGYHWVIPKSVIGGLPEGYHWVICTLQVSYQGWSDMTDGQTQCIDRGVF